MSQTGCPCERFVHPRQAVNPPGRDRVAYRVGDFTAFREALLLPPTADAGLPAEEELLRWRPGEAGDLAVQMAEWWAYLADILTFYNERGLSEALLRTALLPESVRRLIGILGYRPRPGIGARATVAALVSGTTAVTVPQGFPVQSKPGPGQEPQTFEVDAETTLTPPAAAAGLVSSETAPRPDGSVPVVVPPDDHVVHTDNSILLKGIVGSVRPDEELLLLKRGWSGSEKTTYAVVTVAEVKQQKAPRGRSRTTVRFKSDPGLPPDAKVADYRLLRATQTARLWPFTTDTVITDTQATFASLARQLQVGDPLLFQDGYLVLVSGYQEVVWYVNAKDSAHPGTPPDQPTVPVPIPITSVTFTAPSDTPGRSTFNDTTKRKTVAMRFGWQEVGELIAQAATQASASSNLTVAAGALPTNKRVLVEDAAGRGAAATVKDGTVALDPSAPNLIPPLRVLPNVLAVSRGQTVEGEVLGSGDASLPGQEFVLQKAPLTYLSSADTSLGGSYQSTLRVWVDDIEWHEVPSFYGQSRDARVFVTREDEANKTHVLTGDGVYGARLPSGVNNVAASYRYGSGAAAPPAGALTVILRPLPGLVSLRNPVPAGGGDDPEPSSQVRRLAPRSVLAFGRAVSADDYETIAAQAPGVARAQASWVFDAARQRSLVKVFVGDDDSAVASAKLALSGAGDPNRPVLVELAQPVPVALTLTVVLDHDRDPDPVVEAVRTALLDADSGLFGTRAIRVGKSLFASAIHAACLAVPGVRAVHSLSFGLADAALTGYRFDPGEGKFFQLADERLEVNHAS
jgi:hypothetical protein